MKNLVFAACGLVIVLIVVFLFAKGKTESGNVLIPEQKNIASPSVTITEPGSSAKNIKKTYSAPPPVISANEIKGKNIRIKTAKGDIVFSLFEDAPVAASNFIFLTKEGFYDGLTFHRKVDGFVIQGGDPKGDGTGGPGYSFKDETVTKNYEKGIVAMANAGPNTNGSQFFIMLADAPGLPKQYTIFGKVISGQEVVDKIVIGDVIEKVTIE